MIMLGLFGAVLLLVLINVPIAVSLGIVAVIAMVASQGTDILPNVALVTFNGATNFPLLAIPLFILAGAIMNASGISHRRSEEHTSELQSLMRISYAVFCLKQK